MAVVQILAKLARCDFAHLALLIFNGSGGVDYVKSNFLNHGFVFIENAALKKAEAFFHVPAQAEIHAGFVILDGVAAAQNAADSNFERDTKIEGQIRTDREFI